MKAAKYDRKGKTIWNLETGVVEGFKTINQAKRQSWAIQKELDHGLGRGSVRATG